MRLYQHLKYYLSFLLIASAIVLNGQYISVDTETYTSEQLVKEVFFGNQNSNCILVENVNISGWDFGRENRSFGYFDRNGSDFEMEKGIILSTGGSLNAVGPNNYIQSFDSHSWFGDQDLENALNVSRTVNATILEFDFTANNTNKVSFDYLFASEQYLRRQDTGRCDFTDGFAFLIKESGSADPYRNLAVIPGTNIPIKSDNVRGGGERCPAANAEYFGHYNGDESPTNFNGQTKILTATTTVIPGVKYHLKLVIADQGNGLYDSGVFLKAGSFLGSKDLGPDRLFSTGKALCEGSTLTLDATTTGATYQWYKDGNEITGETNAKYIVTEMGIYDVVIDDSGCKLKGSIIIQYVEKAIVNEKSFCNYNDENPISINLQELNNQIISNYKSYFNVKYYHKEIDAIAGNSNIINTLEYKDDTTIYIRVESGSCTPPVKAVHFNSPKNSKILKDQTICANSTTKLATETTFSYYKWKNENGVIIKEGSLVNFVDNISVGKYTVELTSANGCSLVQDVTIFAAELPQITNIEVSGNTATIFVNGGNAPYQYSLDNINFQGSNIFTNIPRGLRKVYVKDAQKCETIVKEFLILNLINVITPNADGKNEVLDYSDLNIKKEVKIEIYDRYGNQVFMSQKQPYIWDGKMNGRVLPTATYWYILNWIEPDTNLPVTHKGWVLLKNRN